MGDEEGEYLVRFCLDRIGSVCRYEQFGVLEGAGFERVGFGWLGRTNWWIIYSYPAAYFLREINSSPVLLTSFTIITLIELFFILVLLFFVFHLITTVYWFLYYEFRQFNRNFASEVYSAATARRVYGNLLKLTDQVETSCNKLVGATMCTVVPINMLILYKLMYPPENAGMVYIFLAYNTTNAGIFMLFTILGGVVQAEATKPLDHFLTINLREKSPEDREELNTLLSVMSGNRVQLTGWKLFQLGPQLNVSWIAFTVSMFFILIDFESSRRRFLESEWNNCSTVCGIGG